MRLPIRVIFSLSLGLLLSACGDSGKVKYDIKMPVNDPAKLSSEARAIYDALEAGQEISFDDISQALAKSHESHYANGTSRVGEVMGLIDEAKGNAPDADPHKRKVQYEDWLTKKKGAAAVYNLDANTIFHFLLENKMQCYSGTVLNQLVNRKSVDAKKFREENWVAIYESGHILSGYLTQANGKWNLFGIETTAEGQAMVEYGPVDAITSEFRLVDAEYWALSELFKFDLKDAAATGNAVLEYTASRYGLGSKLMRIEGTQSALTKINQSPFSFGNANVEPGDRPRGRFDRRDRGSIVGPNPNPLLGSYRETVVGVDRTALVSEIQRNARIAGEQRLIMPSSGPFCQEWSRIGYSYSDSFCKTAGGWAFYLTESTSQLSQLSVEALTELNNVLKGLGRF